MRFDPRDRRLHSGPMSRPPTLPDLPPDGPIEEMVTRFGAELDLMRAQQQTVSRNTMVRDALQPYLDAYEAETGETLDNPFDSFANPFMFDPERGLMIGDEQAQLAGIRKKYDAARSRPGDRMVSHLPPLPDGAALVAQAGQRAQAAGRRAEQAAAVPGTFLGDVAGFVGAAAGAVEDPPNLLSMVFGAPSGAGILRTMATEAAIGAGVELNLQPIVTDWQRTIGNDPTLTDTAINVALAGVGSGVFAGLLKGGARAGYAGWQSVRPLLTRNQRAAIHVADALDTLDRRNPFDLARKIRARSERTGQPPRASFGEELRAGIDDSPEFQVELDRLARELEDLTAEPTPTPTIERTEAGDQLVMPGAEQRSQREILERRMVSRDIRGGQQGLEGLHLFDEGARETTGNLFDVPAATREISQLAPGSRERADAIAAARDAIQTEKAARGRRGARSPIEEQALHVEAIREAEASVEAGQKPDGPAIRAIDESFAEGEIELPVWQARTAKGKTIRWRGPMDVVTWLRTVGGIKDSGGELKSRDLQKLNRGRPGVELAKGEVFLGRLVNNDTGMNLDDATLAAWEAGYFPGRMERPTTDDLLEAIDQTVRAGSDVDRRIWSEHDAELVQRLRGRIDPDEEAWAREVLGDEVVDDALDAIDGMPIVEEPIEPDLAELLNERSAGRWADRSPEDELLDLDDEGERITLAALQDDLAASDFRVTMEETESGEIVSVDRSARDIWQETEAEAAGLEDAAACMTVGAASGA